MNEMAERFDRLLEAAMQSHQRMASEAAQRAADIDALRLLSEATLPPEHSVTGKAAGIARRVLVSEVACAFHLPERTAENLIEASRSLVHDLPLTLGSLAAGRISYAHAQVVVDEAATLDPELAAAFEAAVLPGAERQTVAQLRHSARIVRERIDVDSIQVRAERGACRRAVYFEPAHDGMSWLSAYLPAEQGMAVFNRISDLAASLQGPNETRTLTQLRADVLSDVVVDGTAPAGGAPGIKPDVCLLVPALSLLGHGDEPATLEGYGPISIDTARRLVGDATSFIRVLTHPETGAFLSVGRDRYPAPKDLRTVLRLRDVTCRYPGCRRSASRCDLDHTEDWAREGKTEYGNLAHLCAPHHKLKHESEWAVSQSEDHEGTLHWTSPCGRRYITEPENRFGGDQTGPPPRPM